MHAGLCRPKWRRGGLTAVLGIWLVLLPSGRLAAQAPEIAEGGLTPNHSLTLDECIAIALENQPAINAQRSAKCAAVERRNVARSYFLPQVDFQARYTHIDEPRSVDIPSPFTEREDMAHVFSDAAAYFGIARRFGSAAAIMALDNPDLPPFSLAKQAALSSLPNEFNVGLLGENSLTTDILLVQPLWTGGKIRHRHEQAKLGVRVASADVAKSKQQTVFDVTRAYLGVQLAGELTRVIEDANGHLRAIESLIRALLDQGDEYVTTVDLHRARTVRLLAESERIAAEQAALIAQAALRQAMGLSSTAEFEIADRALIVRRLSLDPQAVLDKAMLQRPELAKARLAVRIAELERQLAGADYLPNVATFGRFGTIDDDGGFANPNDHEEWAVGLTLDVPLYTGGRRSAQTRRAAFEQARAGHVIRLARQLVTLEVRKAYLEHVEMRDRLRVAENAVAEAEGTIEGLRHQFMGDQIKDEDMPDYFEDLVNARILHTLARTRFCNVAHGYNLSLARIRLVSASDEYHGLLDNSPPGVAHVSDSHGPDAARAGAAPLGGTALFKRYDGRQ